MEPVVESVMEPQLHSVEESEIMSIEMTRCGPSETIPKDSGGVVGCEGSFQCSLQQEEQLKNLKDNFYRTFEFSEATWALIRSHLWFETVVEKLRVDPCIDISQLEIKPPAISVRMQPSSLLVAVMMGDVKMVEKGVQKILESRSMPDKLCIDACVGGKDYTTLHLAVMGGDNKIVDAILEMKPNVNLLDWFHRTPLHFVLRYVRTEYMKGTIKILESLLRTNIDMRALDNKGYSAFYVAVAKGYIDIVIELLKSKDKIRLNEPCNGGRPPIQIAHQEGFEDIEVALMKCDEVKMFIESKFRDRQAYVDATNAILVGAALIASVTFASWLQPPLNYTTKYHSDDLNYANIEDNMPLGWFWVFNSLSFYFSIGTVVFGARSVLPRNQLFITEAVEKLSENLLATSILLAVSMLFVIVAFGIGGCIVLIPLLRYQLYMIVPTIFGGIVCLVSIQYLFQSIRENRRYSNRIKNKKEKDILLGGWYTGTILVDN